MSARHAIAIGLLVLGLARPTRAQTMAEVAGLSGPDRLRTIIDGAKKEATLTLYSSAAVEDIAPIIGGFEKTYGIKIKAWRGSSEDIRQRAIAEKDAGRADVDVIETAGPDMEAITREGIFTPMRSPTLDDLVPGAIRPHGQWVTSRISIYAAGYNTNVVRESSAPKSFEDLLDPRWKGKLGVEAEDGGWFMTLAGLSGETKTVELFRKIVQTNGVSVRKGHSLLANLVVSGETPLALTLYKYKADSLAHAGAPVMPLQLGPLIALPTGIGVAAAAPHPHAAALFWEYFLADGQRILAAQDNMPSNRKIKEPPPGINFLDPARFLDEGDKWVGLYREVFAARAR